MNPSSFSSVGTIHSGTPARSVGSRPREDAAIHTSRPLPALVALTLLAEALSASAQTLDTNASVCLKPSVFGCVTGCSEDSPASVMPSSSTTSCSVPTGSGTINSGSAAATATAGVLQSSVAVTAASNPAFNQLSANAESTWIDGITIIGAKGTGTAELIFDVTGVKSPYDTPSGSSHAWVTVPAGTPSVLITSVPTQVTSAKIQMTFGEPFYPLVRFTNWALTSAINGGASSDLTLTLASVVAYDVDHVIVPNAWAVTTSCLVITGPPLPPNGRLYVDASATGLNTGWSWTDALTSLRDALEIAKLGSPGCGVKEIWVADGTYRPNASFAEALAGPDARKATFPLRSGVAVYGGFAGGEASLFERHWVLNQTILSGNIGDVASVSDNSYNVVTGSGASASTRLDGFTIRDGYADGAGSGKHEKLENRGAGIYTSGVSGSIAYPTLYPYAVAPTIANCTFTANSANYGGGGMWNRDASPKIQNCAFIANVASTYRGGALVNEGFKITSNPTIERCVFEQNTARDGGAAYNVSTLYPSTPYFVDCQFLDNHTTPGGGGALLNASLAAPRFVDCLFAENTAVGVGGAVQAQAGTFVGCTLHGNHASTTGGAIYVVGSGPVLENCIVYGNTAGMAGTSQFGPQNPGVRVTYSLVQGGFAGIGNLNADPKFAGGGSYALVQGSPCIDAGDNAAFGPYGVTTDLAGAPRFVDDPTASDTGVGPAPVVDMGALEFQFASPCSGAAAASVYGTGKPGSTGVPTLSSGLPIVPHPALRISIQGGTPGLAGYLLGGDAPLNLPFDDGTLLVLPALVLPIGLDPSGAFTLEVKVTGASLCGSTYYLQAMFPFDPGASGRFRTSQTAGLALTFGR